MASNLISEQTVSIQINSTKEASRPVDMEKESQKNQRDESRSRRDTKESSLPSEISRWLQLNCFNGVLTGIWKQSNTGKQIQRNPRTVVDEIVGELNQNNEPSLSNKKVLARDISKIKRDNQISKVYGFENEALSLERMLLKGGNDDHRFRGVGVVGMAGVGKSTLCRKIFREKEVMNHFVPRIWVTMSRQRNNDKNLKVEIVRQMLECLGVGEEIIESIFEDYECDGLLYALYQELIGKSYLIVLDDFDQDVDDGWFNNLYSCLSHGEKWGQHLSDGLPKGCGGTVIVTSRNVELAKKMVGGENLYQLQPLSDPKSCWSIYKDAAGLFDPQTPEESERLEKLQEELMKKCGGLPLAAKLMGQIKGEQLKPHQAALEAATKSTKK